MNRDKQNEALAILDGWESYTQQFLDESWQSWRNPKYPGEHILPDYVGDLNNIYKIEELLTEDQWDQYWDQFSLLQSSDSRIKSLLHNTPERKAEALLWVFGLWDYDMCEM